MGTGLAGYTVVQVHTMMESPSNYHDLGKILSRLAGVAALVLLLLWNPLVLRPRHWTVATVAFSVSVDAALIIAGVGLVCLKRWGGLALSALTLALLARTSVQSPGLPWSLALLLPILFTAFFWRVLRWGNARRDVVFVLGGIVASGLLNYIAYVSHHA